jgi:hypothetical protein
MPASTWAPVCFYGEKASLQIKHRSRKVVQTPYTLESVAGALVIWLGPAPVD